MQVLIFLSANQLQFLDFTRIKQSRKSTRLVLIETPEKLESLSPHLRFQFEKIYTCPRAVQEDVLSALDGIGCCGILENELSLNNDPNQFHIFTFYEFNTLLSGQLSGKLCDKYKIPGTGALDLSLFRDKILMKDMLLKKGLRVPKYLKLERNRLASEATEYFEFLSQKIGLPFIAKPTDGAASLGVYKIFDEAEFISFVSDTATNETPYEAEEFIEGTLYHCDAVISERKILFMECGQYTCPNFESAQGKTLGSIILPKWDLVRSNIVQFAQQCLEALGSVSGASHMEVFLTASGEMVFLEVGARPPGLDVCRIYKNLFGISLQNLVVESALGLETQAQSIAESHMFWAHVPTQKGTVVALNRPTLRSDAHVEFFVSPHESFTNSLSYLNCLAKVEAKNSSFEELKSDFEIVRRFSFVEWEGNAMELN